MPPNRGHTGYVYTINKAFRQFGQPLHCHRIFFGTRLILIMTAMKGSVRPPTKGIASHRAMGLVETERCIEEPPIHIKCHSYPIFHSTSSNLFLVSTLANHPK